MHKYQKIYEYYLQKSQKVINYFQSPDVLKVDVYNELMDAPFKGGIVKNISKGNFFLLDNNKNYINRVLKKFPELKITNGDIRNILFSSNNFDVILDLSTIDHVPDSDTHTVISEYYRVLRTDGILLLIAWFSEKQKIEWLNDAFPLQLSYLKKLLSGKFKILEEETFYTEKDAFMHSIIARKLPWMHLQTRKLDARFLVVAGYLANKVKDKYIMDLNCSNARLLEYIPHTFASYYGNDIFIDVFPDYKNTFFEKITDEEVIDKYKYNKLDILLVFGHGAGHILENKWESKTLDQSIRKIVEKFRPSIIVLEASYEYEHSFFMLWDLVNCFQINCNYKIAHSIEIDSLEPINFSKRIIYILEE